MMSQLCAVLAFVATAHVARADEFEENFVYVPAEHSESLTVEQKLGKLTLRGWDKPEVRIAAHKHARDVGRLDRLRVSVIVDDGKIFVRAGVRIGAEVRPWPVDGGGIDLTIDAPRHVLVRASTGQGDLEASGFRSGAVIDSTGGEVSVRDVEGRVHSWTLKGRQRLAAIRGDVEAGGMDGDVELEQIGGDRLTAWVNEGQITARGISTPVVRLYSVAGAVVFSSSLQAGGRYELTSLDGDVRLELERAPFTVHARAGGRVRSLLALRGRLLPQEVQGEFAGGGPELELTAMHGDVVLQPRK
jgi:hypothetical protein